MPGLNKNRKRPITLAFRVSQAEANHINERIQISGLPRGKYFIQTFQKQKIYVSLGKFESNRLSLEFKRLRNLLENMEDHEDINDALNECKTLLEELKPFFPLPEKQEKEEEPIEFDDFFMDEEIV